MEEKNQYYLSIHLIMPLIVNIRNEKQSKERTHKQQQNYKKPELYPYSKHPELHFHEGQKPDIDTIGNNNISNTHHTF